MKVASLIIKPQALKNCQLGEIISICEDAGLYIIDCYAINLDYADLIDFSEIRAQFPSTAESESFIDGLSVIIGFEHEEAVSILDRLELDKEFPVYVSKEENFAESEFDYWFGVSNTYSGRS